MWYKARLMDSLTPTAADVGIIVLGVIVYYYVLCRKPLVDWAEEFHQGGSSHCESESESGDSATIVR